MSEPPIYFTIEPGERCRSTYSRPPMRAVTCTCVQDVGHLGDHMGFDRHGAVHSWRRFMFDVEKLAEAVDRMLDQERIR